MKRSKPLVRRTPLAQGKPLERKTPLARGTSAPRQRSLRRPKMPVEIRDHIIARAKGRCDLCGGRLAPDEVDAHHRQLRTRGGKDTAENLVALHRRCHMWLHEHPAEATAIGFMVSAWQDPGEIPVLLWRQILRFPRDTWSAA